VSEKKRKVHSPEFKAKVGLEALKGLKTINEIGQEYGVHPVQVVVVKYFWPQFSSSSRIAFRLHSVTNHRYADVVLFSSCIGSFRA
jgi:transposase-like protein